MRRLLAVLAALTLMIGLVAVPASADTSAPAPGATDPFASCTTSTAATCSTDPDPSPQTTSSAPLAPSESIRVQVKHGNPLSFTTLDTVVTAHYWPDGSFAHIYQEIDLENYYVSYFGGADLSQNAVREYVEVNCYTASSVRRPCYRTGLTQRAWMGNKGEHDVFWNCGYNYAGTCAVTGGPANQSPNNNEVYSPTWKLQSSIYNPTATTGCKDPVYGLWYQAQVINYSANSTWQPASIPTDHFRVCDTTDN